MTDGTGKAVERLAGTTNEPRESILDSAIALGEQNTHLAQEAVTGYIRGLRRQTEDTLTMMEATVERSERQKDVFQELLAEYVGVCAGLYFSPLLPRRRSETANAARTVQTEGEPPSISGP